MLVIIFWGSISKYSREASPQILLEKREKRLLVDTVGTLFKPAGYFNFIETPVGLAFQLNGMAVTDPIFGLLFLHFQRFDFI